jgi:AraC-like DNA-binding protein
MNTNLKQRIPYESLDSVSLYTPYKLVALTQVLGAHDIAIEDVLDGTGLAASELDNPNLKTSIAQFVHACRNAQRLVSDPRVPFEIAKRMHLSAYGMFGYALICSTSMRAFLDQAIKYRRLATPVYVQEWEESGSSALWRFERPTISDLETDLQEFLLAQQIAMHVIHIQDALGSNYSPAYALLRPESKKYAQLYAEILQCPISWTNQTPMLCHDPAILDKPALLANKMTSTLMQDTCNRLLEQTKTSTGTRGQVYQILMARQTQFPTMEEVAEILHMNERTLRRKLESENVSFIDILDDVRQSLAIEYLTTTRMKTENIAALIGFSDAANFRRAFKRWTGKTPREYQT